MPEWTQWMGMGVRGDEGEKALYLDTAPYSRKGKNSTNVHSKLKLKSSTVRTYIRNMVISNCIFVQKIER